MKERESETGTEGVTLAKKGNGKGTERSSTFIIVIYIFSSSFFEEKRQVTVRNLELMIICDHSL